MKNSRIYTRIMLLYLGDGHKVGIGNKEIDGDKKESKCRNEISDNEHGVAASVPTSGWVDLFDNDRNPKSRSLGTTCSNDNNENSNLTSAASPPFFQ